MKFWCSLKNQAGKTKPVKIAPALFSGMPHDSVIRNMMTLCLACQNYRSLHCAELMSMLKIILIW